MAKASSPAEAWGPSPASLWTAPGRGPLEGLGWWLVSSPCWPEATWYPVLSPAHCPGPHTPTGPYTLRLGQPPLTMGEKRGVTSNRHRQGPQKVSRGGRALRGSGGRGRGACPAFRGDGCEGQAFERQAPGGALFLPRSLGTSSLSSSRTQAPGWWPGSALRWGDYKRLVAPMAQSRTPLPGSHAPPFHRHPSNKADVALALGSPPSSRGDRLARLSTS